MGLVDLYSIVYLTCSVRMLTLLSNSGKAGSSAALKVANVVSCLDINLYRYPSPSQLVHVRLRVIDAKNKADRQLLAMLDCWTIKLIHPIYPCACTYVYM